MSSVAFFPTYIFIPAQICFDFMQVDISLF